jgi:hypothetical protein
VPPTNAMPALIDAGALPIGTHERKSLAHLSGRRPGRGGPVLPAPLEGLWSSLAYDLIGLSSVAAIVVAVRRHQPARPLIWWCFAAGQLLFVVGDMLYVA